MEIDFCNGLHAQAPAGCRARSVANGPGANRRDVPTLPGLVQSLQTRPPSREFTGLSF